MSHRIERWQPALNCFIRITAEAARKKPARPIGPSRPDTRSRRSMACRWRTRICSIAPARFAPAAQKSAPTSIPDQHRNRAPAGSTRPEASSSAGSTWQSSPPVRPVTTITLAGAAIPGIARAYHRWLVIGLRRRGRRWPGIWSTRLGHRRIGQATGRGVRRGGHQADAWPRKQIRRNAAIVLVRLHRRSGPQCR